MNKQAPARTFERAKQAKKSCKIFISHHHDDAAALSQLKSMLEPVGFSCFLAHEDIEPGAHDLETIEKEIRDCDAFLYVGSKKANASEFCPQEIGMAKVLGKYIITAMTKNNPPRGFISHTNAIKYTQIDPDFYSQIYEALRKKFPLTGKLKRHLDALGWDGFSRTRTINTIHLLDDNFNDFGFYTTFIILVDGVTIGHVKIGFIGQQKRDRTHDKLLNRFDHLALPYFSRVAYIGDKQTKLTGTQINSLKHLLNDTEMMTTKDQNTISGEPVFGKSLYR